jgi:hypothetical protein
MQRLGNHIPAATETKATMEDLCALCGPCRDIISKGQGQSSVSSVLECEERTWAGG